MYLNLYRIFIESNSLALVPPANSLPSRRSPDCWGLCLLLSRDLIDQRARRYAIGSCALQELFEISLRNHNLSGISRVITYNLYLTHGYRRAQNFYNLPGR